MTLIARVASGVIALAWLALPAPLATQGTDAAAPVAGLVIEGHAGNAIAIGGAVPGLVGLLLPRC